MSDYFKEFLSIIKQVIKLHKKKNSDYANEEPLSNFMMCEKMGIPAWQGVLIRITDKVSRLCTFANRGNYEVSDERVEDTFLDLIVYGIIGLLLYKRRRYNDHKTGDDNIINELTL